MEFRHLATFQEVVKRGTFLAAAAELGCAQSTVTLHVQQLEATLGAPLFERGARRVRLTEAGRALHEQSGPILSRVTALRESIADLTGGESGHLRIGVIEPLASVRLPPLLVRFCRERPRVRLTIEIGGTESIARRVASGDIDAGVCTPPPVSLGLRFEPLLREPLGLLLPIEHPLAEIPVVRIAALAGQRLLLTERTCAYRDLTEHVLQERGVSPTGGIEIGSIQALVWAVRAGLGAAIVPFIAVDPPPDGTVLRTIEDVELVLTVGLVHAVEAPMPGRALAEFLSAIRSHLPRSMCREHT